MTLLMKIFNFFNVYLYLFICIYRRVRVKMRHLKILTFQEKQKTNFFLTPPTFVFLAWIISNRCFSRYVSICKLLWKLLVCKKIKKMCLCRILWLCFCKSKTDIITCRVLYMVTVRSKTDINPMSCFDLIFPDI